MSRIIAYFGTNVQKKEDLVNWGCQVEMKSEELKEHEEESMRSLNL